MMEDRNSKTIKITAVIPAYNAEKYIGRAIDSILRQTHPVDEILVVDDGSTDNTADVVRSYGDKVKLLSQENGGVSAARNAGIQAAAGDWIAFLDADDEWLPEKTALQVKLLNKNSNLVWMCGNYIVCLCDEKRQKARHSETMIRKSLNGRDYFEDYFAAFLHSISGHTDTMLIKKDVLLEAGLFQVGQQQMEDMDLWWKIAIRYPTVGYSAQPIAIHHLRAENSLIQSQTDFSKCRRMIQRHLAASSNTAYAESVKACSAMMLRLWMRSMLFDKKADEVRMMLTEFKYLFSPGYRWMMRLLTWKPDFTAGCLRLMSCVIRFLRIRRQLTRKPKKLDE